MTRFRRVLVWVGGGVFVGAVVLPVLGVAALNIGPGRVAVEVLVDRVTRHQVRLTGLHGRFPDALRLAHLEVHDREGAWLIADDVALDWSPTALLGRRAVVDLLSAGRVAVPRLPVSAAGSTSSSRGPFSLPLPVSVRRLRLAEVALGAPVAGVAVAGAAGRLAVEGGGTFVSLQQADVTLALHRLDQDGAYALAATLDPAQVKARLTLTEPAGGLVAGLAGLPDVGALQGVATLDGPRRTVATVISLTAGPLKAGARGSVDLAGDTLALDVTGSAPAMTPRPDMHWEGLALQAHVTGPFRTPDAQGSLQVMGLAAGGAGLRTLNATVQGNAGQVSVHAVAEQVRLPAAAAGLLADTPVVMDATVRLDDPARPVRFDLTHRLLTVHGNAGITDATVNATVVLADLAPIGALVQQDLRGHAGITVKGGASHLELVGSVGLVAGAAAKPVQALLGPDAIFGATLDRGPDRLMLSHVTLTGQAVGLTAEGRVQEGRVDATAHVSLPRLAALAAQLQGGLELDARAGGTTEDVALDVEGKGAVTVPGVPTGPLRFTAHATGLPGAPAGRVVLQGALAGSPVMVTLDAKRAAEGLQATIEGADWRSLHAEGTLGLATGATLPRGRISLRMTRLDDLDRLLNQTLTGSVTAEAVLDDAVRVTVEARNAGVPAGRVDHATLQARVVNPTRHPAVTAALVVDGLDAGVVTGGLKLDVTGPEEALATRLSAGLRVRGVDTQISGLATVDAVQKLVRLAALQGTGKGETVRLLTPAQIRLAGGVAVDRLRLGLRAAVLDVAGRLSPALDATVTLRSPADLVGLFVPEAAADGTIALDAALKGNPSAPQGTVRLAATGIRARTGAGRALPPADLVATAGLGGGAAQIEARLNAGAAARLAVTGRAPLGAGALDLHAAGGLDLALLNPILGVSGRQVRGRVQLDAGVAGTLASPRASGTATVVAGEIQDFTQGVRVSGINGVVRAEGDMLRIQDLNGRAGPGTIAVSGTVGLASGNPVDLTVQLRQARPLASDRLTADLDGDLTLRGPVAALQAGGTVTVRRAEIVIPDRLPASVAVLDVRRPGQKPPVASAAAPVGLDLTLQAPRALFVRGRGVDAELGGTVRLRGTSAVPDVGGAFELRRGSMSVAGATLNFSRGKIGFDGTGLSGKIDPTLDFAADSAAANVTATLGIGGTASAPKITLTSVPDLPPDEVLAYLLFKRSAKELGPFQLAEIVAALGSLTGVGGGVGNPLESVRKGLGLDRLSVGSATAVPGSTTAASSAPTVEAGRYVGNGVYVGAKQGTTGGQTGATVQIDITKGLKVQTDVGTGTGGTSVGVTYQFEY